MKDKYVLILLVFLFGFLNIGVLLLMLQAFKFQGDLLEICIMSLVMVLINYVALMAFSDENEDDI